MARSYSKIYREANFLSLAGNVSFAMFGFASFAIMARSFPLNVFGEWVLYISSATFIEMFRFGITNMAIVRYLSGAEGDDRIKYIGSNGAIVLVSTIAISIILWSCHFLFGAPIQKAGYELFFKWYPILAFANIPFNSAMVILQAKQNFGKILLLRTINAGSFFLVVLFGFVIRPLSITELVWAQILINISTSTLSYFKHWDGMRFIFRATREHTKTLLHFGKYTVFTLIGTNLLRSADTFIISLSPLGTAAVALYSIPMKLTEMQQIPLRSFVATAFPKMSKASIKGEVEEVKKLFYVYSGAMTYLLIFISLCSFIFAGFFVQILGGSQFLGTDPVTGANTVLIVRIFSLYGILLPIDRMTGIGLDSINKPVKNFQKVMFMVATNIIGDLIAVFVFKSLEAVAIASILFTLFGILIGFYYMDKQLDLQKRLIFTEGISFYKSIFQKAMKFGKKGNT
jgi:O-antigen/teichoic acid export membrane protein